MRPLPLLLLALVLPAPSSSCGLDIFGVCGGADKVADALKELPDRVREAAEQVLDHFFKDLLPPAVDKITAAAQQLEDRAEKDYEKAINATREQLEELAKAVVQLAEEYAKNVTSDIEEIVDHVEKDTSKLIQQVVLDVDRRVNEMLSRLENDGKELFCAAQGYLDVLEKQISSYFQKQDCECVQEMLKANPGLAQDCACTSCFNIGGFYPQCKCNPWGPQFGPAWYNQGKFDFLKCHLEKAIDWEHWTVNQIVKQLSILQEAALSFRCLEDLNPGSTRNRQYFTDQYTNITHTILVWTRGPSATHSSKAQQPMGAIPSQAGAGDPCGGMTIQECLTRVMSKVQDARQDLEKAKADFDKATADVEGNLTREHEWVLSQGNETRQDLQRANATLSSDLARENEEVKQLAAKVASAQLSTECREIQTPPNDGGDGSTAYLDRHDVRCADGEHLAEWKLIRQLINTIQISYVCCKSQIVMPGRSVIMV